MLITDNATSGKNKMDIYLKGIYHFALHPKATAFDLQAGLLARLLPYAFSSSKRIMALGIMVINKTYSCGDSS